MFLQKLKEMLPFTKENKQVAIKKRQQQLVKEKLFEVISNSYYDEKSNTLVVNTPTNLILNVKGSIMNVAREGYIVDVADAIHLNPELSEKTKINIRKLDKSFDEVVEPLSKSIEE